MRLVYRLMVKILRIHEMSPGASRVGWAAAKTSAGAAGRGSGEIRPFVVDVVSK